MGDRTGLAVAPVYPSRTDRAGPSGGPAGRARRRSDPFFEFELADALPALLVLALLVQSARAFDIFLPSATRIAYVVQVAAVTIYLFRALLNGHINTVIAGVAAFAYLLFGQFVFQHNTGVPLNVNSIFGQFAAMSFVCFVECKTSIVRLLRIMFLASTAYVLIYLAGQKYFLGLTGPEAAPGTSIVGGADATRAARVFLAPSFAAFVASYGLEHRKAPLMLRLTLIGLGVGALWLSGGRFYLASFAVVFAIALSRANIKSVRVALLVAFLALSAILLAGIFVDSWNPYALLTGDDSGFARSREYVTEVRAIGQHFLFGVGTPASQEALAHYLQTPRYEPVYATDLGAVGIMFQAGLVGLVVFLAGTAVCLLSGLRTFASPEIRALQLTCMTMGLVGVSAPFLFLTPETVFFTLLVAALVRRATAEQRWRAIRGGDTAGPLVG